MTLTIILLAVFCLAYANGANDNFKGVATLFGSGATNYRKALLWATITTFLGLVIAFGGLVSARRVAETMSRKITPMNSGQGFTANLVTGLIVIGASRLGLPVSTTHVSCGALFGIGTITGQARWGTTGKIVAAWLTTLPLGAALGAICFSILR